MSSFYPRLMLLIALLFVAVQAHAVNPFLDWRTLETNNFYIHFDGAHHKTAKRAAGIAEAVHQRLSKEFNWQPTEKTHIVLSDETDFANGFATVINFNRSVLFLAPPMSVNGLEDFDDWLSVLITHEYTHILHLDKVAGTPSFLRKIFGRFILSFPNLLQPSWLIEGIATYKETNHQRKVGRGQNALFYNMMRMEVLSGIKPVEQVNLPITTWPAGTTRYLYGVYFYEFVRQTYGEEKIQALVEAYSDNLIPYYLNTTFKAVFGKDVSQMWKAYSAWLTKKFLPEVKTIEQKGVIAGNNISNSAYRTGSVRATQEAVYYIENNGSEQASLVKWLDGKKTVLTEVHGAGFDVQTNGDVLLSQVEVCDEYNLYNDLYVYNDGNNQLEQITQCGRYVRAIWHPDGQRILALKHEASTFKLLSLNRIGDIQNELIKFDDGTIVAWFDISPDAQEMVFSLWKQDQGWNLFQYSLLTKQWHQITSDNNVQASPEYSSNGDTIFYSANYNGSYDLYRYDIKTKSHHKITRTLGGAYQSANIGDDLYYIGYTGKGTDVYSLNSYKILDTFAPSIVESPKHINYPDVATSYSEYSPWKSLRPRSWFPSVFITPDVAEIGITTSGNDALGVHNYLAFPAYDVKNNVPALQFIYSYSNIFTTYYARTNRAFRATNGELNRIRSEDNFQFIYALPKTKILSSSVLLFSLSWDNSFDNKLFNGAIPVNDFSDNQLSMAWLYNNARQYPLSISVNDGRSIRLVAEDSQLLNSDFNGQVYTLSWKEFIHLGGEHVLALNALQGWGEGITSNFQLGGEDTGVAYTLLLQQTGVGVFDRRDYPLRGYADGLPQLRGRRAQLFSLEWRFPGQRIERGLMVPPVGLMQWSGTFFAETGTAYNGSKPDKYYSSAGFEISTDLALAYLVPLKARLGIAHGFDHVIGDTRAYLSLGSSF